MIANNKGDKLHIKYNASAIYKIYDKKVCVPFIKKKMCFLKSFDIVMQYFSITLTKTLKKTTLINSNI